MLENEYFDNPEHYGFENMVIQIYINIFVTFIDNVIQFKVQIVKSGE